MCAVKNLLTAHEHTMTIKEVLKEEAQAILNLVNQVDEEAAKVIDMILGCSGRVIVTGVGKSGIIGKKITATLASTGTPAFFLHPGDGLHGDLGMVTNTDIVLALSKSGETEEILNIIPSIKRIGSRLIAFVGERHSTLANTADHVLSIGDVDEACPLGLAPTTSTTLMLAYGDAIAIALLKARNFSSEEFAIYHPGGTLGKKLLLTVQHIIDTNKRNPVIMHTDTVQQAIFTMTDSRLGATCIVNQDGILAGILTDGDIRRSLAKGQQSLDMYVKDLYNNNPITIKQDQLAATALHIMENEKINVLPVINELNEPIAMIHLHDITRMGI